jgi:hypothetical protein
VNEKNTHTVPPTQQKSGRKAVDLNNESSQIINTNITTPSGLLWNTP